MTAVQTGTGATQLESARQLLIERRLRGGDGLAPIPRVARDGAAPLSPGQSRLWFLDALAPGSTEWVVPLVLRRDERFDVRALRRALDALERRHEALRTRYLVTAGQPSQLIAAPAGVPLEVIDDADVAATVQAAQAVPFDLGSGRLLRAALARETGGPDWLVLTTHHIACDGWSTDLLARDLGACYAAELGQTPEPLAPALQYADYAVWAAGRPPAADELAYWREQLRGIQALELPTDRPRGVTRDATARRHVTELDGSLAARVRETAGRFATTPFAILVTAFGLMLARRSGQHDVCIGTPVAGRPRTQLHGVVGYFANTLVLRIRPGQTETVGDLVTAARECVLAALAHQNVPFEQLVSDAAPERDLSRNAVIDVLFVYEQVAAPDGQPSAHDLVEMPVASPTVKSDLLLGVRDDGSGPVAVGLDYASALFDDDTAAALATDWVRCVALLCADPEARLDQLPLVDAADEAWLAGLDGRRRDISEWTLPALIREQAHRTPDAVAVEDQFGSLSYAELVERAARLATRLTGAGPDAVVGVCLERGVGLLVTLVGVLASGAAYLPLDPDHPPGRLAELLTAVHPAHVVTSSVLRDRLPHDLTGCVLVDDPLPTTRHWAAGTSDDLVYVLHTSGSTGTPKGVMITHRGIVNRLQWMQSMYGLRPDDRVLQKTPITFDVSVWELFWPLLVGARVVFAPPGLHLEPARLADFANEHHVTHVHFVPSMLDLFLDLTATFPARVREVLCSGEALRAGTVRRLAERSTGRVHNLYGPTEASIDVTYLPVPAATVTDPVPIGHAVDNTTVQVLDAALRRCPRGVVGEIHLGGVQLARGYLHRPDLTADRFVPDPFAPGERMYRTGDRGYLDRDGAVVYVGRTDAQTKIRGVRIEPGEVEAALCEHPQVTGACVCVVDDPAGEAVLVGHLTGTGPVDHGELRDLLAKRLPAAFVPAYFAQHATFPMTTSGKTDRGALAAAGVPARVGGHARRESRPPGPIEHIVLRVFEEVLGRTGVGVDESFFAIGGDSMRAVRVVGALNARGLAVAVADLFRAPTAEQLARVTGMGADDDVRPVTAFELVSAADRKRVPAGVTDMYPLSQIQAGMIFEMLGNAAVRPYHNVIGAARMASPPKKSAG